jgi:hypothetical protein
MEADPMPALTNTSANAIRSIQPGGTATIGGFEFNAAL